MQLAHHSLAILCSCALAAAAPQSGLAETAEFTASGLPSQERFGDSLALSGRTAVIGGGLGQSQDAYVFEETGSGPLSVWTEVTKLVSSVPADLHGPQALDGDRAVVGSALHDHGGVSDAGSVFVFERDAGGPSAWGEAAWIRLGDPMFQDRFGTSVSLEGDLLAVGASGRNTGAPGAGAVYLFERNQGGPGAWGLVAQLAEPVPAASAQFGRRVALSGNTLAIGSGPLSGFSGSGTVHVFVKGPAGWSHEVELYPADVGAGDDFGVELALEGDLLAVGAPFTCHLPSGTSCQAFGSVYLFERNQGGPGAWGQTQRLEVTGPGSFAKNFGDSLDLSGERLLIGASSTSSVFPLTGSAYLFERSAGIFAPSAQLLPDELFYLDGFGQAVGVDGSRVLVGSPWGALGGKPYVPDVSAAALHPSDGLLYVASEMSSAATSDLLRVDPVTAAVEYLGPTGAELRGLAFDPATGTLYGIEAFGPLVSVDPATGLATPIGGVPSGQTRMQSLAFDAASGMLYSTNIFTDELVLVDPATGALTAIGPTVQKDLYALSFDAETGQLYGVEFTVSPWLVSVDVATGQAQRLLQMPFAEVRSLADRPGPGLLQSCTGEGLLIEVDVSQGITQIGCYSPPTLTGTGTVYAFDLPTSLAPYCTAGTSASGCMAALGATGIASSSAASGFTLFTGSVEGAKDGLFFFGTNGRQANPWGSGTSYQCVAPPVSRGGLLAGSGTSGACNGAFSQDLNAFWCPTCPKPAKNPGAGATVQAQLWYRDPLNPSNQTTSLSDAIEFTVSP